MRKLHHVDANTAVSGAPSLDRAVMDELRKHRWVREPTGLVPVEPRIATASE